MDAKIRSLETDLRKLERKNHVDNVVLKYVMLTINKAAPDLFQDLLSALDSHADGFLESGETVYRGALKETGDPAAAERCRSYAEEYSAHMRSYVEDLRLRKVSPAVFTVVDGGKKDD